jgi:phospholipid/cholesterol/gamma-HCH transport system substrate-binding protein
MSAETHTETIVGAAVLAAAGLFLIYALSSTGSRSFATANGYQLSAEFDSVEGIAVGTDVRLAGIKIGSVTGQSLNKESFQARLDFVIDKTVVLSDDTTAKVTSEGLLGGRYLALEPGGSDTKLADGGVINFTQGSVDMWSLISETMFQKNAPKATAPAETQPQK